MRKDVLENLIHKKVHENQGAYIETTNFLLNVFVWVDSFKLPIHGDAQKIDVAWDGFGSRV